MAPLIYRPEGENIAKQLWEETMTELSFAKVREVIHEVASGNVNLKASQNLVSEG